MNEPNQIAEGFATDFPTVSRTWEVVGPRLPHIDYLILTAEAFRAALMAVAGRLTGREKFSDPLHSFGFFLPTPGLTQSHTSQLRLLAPAVTAKEVAMLTPGLTRITVKDHGSWSLSLTDCAKPGAARQWRSLTPFYGTRHAKIAADGTVKGNNDARGQLLRCLAQAGLVPDSIEQVRSNRGPYLIGDRARSVPMPRSAISGSFRVTFRVPTLMPPALGALKHFGLGQFAPEPETESPPL